MSVREESARVSSAHGQDSSSRQLPGVHELFSAGLQNGSQHSGRLAPVSESQARTGQPTLPQVGSFKGPSHWQHSPAFPSLSAHATHVDSPPFAPSTAVSGAVQGRSPYAAPVPRLPPVVPRDFRGQGPFLDPAADDLRRDSARSNSTQSATTVTECIGQQHFPGRGLCYVYRDGATCPTVIDGEVVNPLWGTTKAGKARKRLAQACLSCREKKIRCEPQLPRCVQCEKSKRECVMPSTMTTLEHAPAMAQQIGGPYYSLAPISPPTMPRPQTESLPSSLSRSSLSSKRRRSEELAPGYPQQDAGRGMPMHFKQEPSMVVLRDDGTFVSSREPSTRPTVEPRNPSLSPPTSADPFAWHNDPYDSNSEGTLRFLDAIFVPTLAVYNRMVPQMLFRRWVIESRSKRPEECMVLYSMLALGSAMLRDPSSFARLCQSRAVASMEGSVGRFSFLLAQARMYMTHFAYAQGQEEVASEYNAAAVHVLKMEGLVSEEACTARDRYSEDGVFGMNEFQVAESKRRTLWVGFVMDQFSTVHSAVIGNFPDGTMYLRHPCSEDGFERGLPSRAPFYEPSLRTSLPPGLQDRAFVSPLAHVSNIARLVGDQSGFLSPRLRLISVSNPGNFARDYEDYLRGLDTHLSAWLATLPPDMLLTQSNFYSATNKSDFALSMSVTALYHIAIIHATRFTKHEMLSRALVERNIRRAHQSAQEVMKLTNDLCMYGQTLPEGQGLQHVVPPFLAYAMSLAVDTLCAGGALSDLRVLLSSVMNTCTVMGTLGYVWARPRVMQRILEGKIADLQEIERHGEQIPSGFRIIGNSGWRCSVALRKKIRLEDDVTYGVDDAEYLRAIAR